MSRRKGPPVGQMSQAQRRQSIWKEARRVRHQLTTFATQREVGAVLSITQQAVEKIELSALSKLILRMRSVV